MSCKLTLLKSLLYLYTINPFSSFSWEDSPGSAKVRGSISSPLQEHISPIEGKCPKREIGYELACIVSMDGGREKVICRGRLAPNNYEEITLKINFRKILNHCRDLVP